MQPALAVQPGLVVLTRYDARFGEGFLQQLAAQGLRPELIVVAHTTLGERLRMARFLARKIGWRDALRYNKRFLGRIASRCLSGGRRYPVPDFSVFGAPLLHCRNINDAQVAEALKAPGYTRLILAQSGIVRKALLELPGKWIVNAHPGTLPDYRGVDVVKWALRDAAPVQVTLHLVRAGVDTGEVLHAEPVPVLPTDSIADVEARSIAVSQDLLLRAATQGQAAFPSPVPQPAGGKQYYLMPFADLAALERNWTGIRNRYAAPLPQ